MIGCHLSLTRHAVAAVRASYGRTHRATVDIVLALQPLQHSIEPAFCTAAAFFALVHLGTLTRLRILAVVVAISTIERSTRVAIRPQSFRRCVILCLFYLRSRPVRQSSIFLYGFDLLFMQLSNMFRTNILENHHETKSREIPEDLVQATEHDQTNRRESWSPL